MIFYPEGQNEALQRKFDSLEDVKTAMMNGTVIESKVLLCDSEPNLRAKAKLWLWELRDVAIIGIGFLFSVLALANGAGMFLMVLTVLYAFLSIRMEGASILDFLRCAICFLFLHQQYYEWKERKS